LGDMVECFVEGMAIEGLPDVHGIPGPLPPMRRVDSSISPKSLR
jgi:hypothetical protein